MIRRLDQIAIAFAVLLTCATANATTMLTGEVRAVDAQQIVTPPSNSSPVVLRYFVADGAQVKHGDVLVRIDPGTAAAQLEQIASQIEQSTAKAAKEVAELRVKAVDAELAQVDADAALQTAGVDAQIPKNLISGIDYDRYQGELDRTRRELDLKIRELASALAAVKRRVADAQLEISKLIALRDFAQIQVDVAEVRADRDGTVIHGFASNSESGKRYDEGSSTYPGQKIGEVVGAGPMAVRAYALEPDRGGLALGDVVDLLFDALPGRHVTGHITSIAGAPQTKSEWGDGRYFQIDIALPPQVTLPLRSGMSVRVTVSSPVKFAARSAAR